MKQRTLEKIALNLGKEIEYRPYSYWDNVPHIGKTALVFHCNSDTGNFWILKNSEVFPSFVTKQYIVDCVESGKTELGFKKSYNLRKPFGAKVWFPAL